LGGTLSGELNVFKKLFIVPTDLAAVQFLRYLMVGGVAFVADFATLFLLTDVGGLYYLHSSAIAFLVGLAVNYILSIRWVFAQRALDTWIYEFAIFAILGIIGLGLNQVLMYVFTDLANFHYLISKAVATIATLLWNFLSRKVLLFQKKLPLMNETGD
jgi:putative flippase GtrA